VAHRPKVYSFQGQVDKRYIEKIMQQIIKTALVKAGIGVPAGEVEGQTLINCKYVSKGKVQAVGV
jgi:hypothetical protein